jgi:hypothetical protein
MKKVILIIALLFPIGVFVFLRFFGKNEFTIPVYYENGIETIPTACTRKYQSPYLVSDSLLINFGWSGRPVLIVTDTSQSVQKGLMRLDEELSAEIQTIFLSGEKDYLDQVFMCDLLLQKPWTTVLLDDQRKIRGYYDPKTREEVDRLIVELKILLKKY